MGYKEHEAVFCGVSKNTVHGIKIESRYGAVRELTSMMMFAQECFEEKINHYIKRVFFDSPNCIIDCHFRMNVRKYDPIGILFMKIAKKHFGSIGGDFIDDHLLIFFVFEDDCVCTCSNEERYCCGNCDDGERNRVHESNSIQSDVVEELNSTEVLIKTNQQSQHQKIQILAREIAKIFSEFELPLNPQLTKIINENLRGDNG